MDDCLQGLIEMSEYNTYWRHREKRRSDLTTVKDIFAVTKRNAGRQRQLENARWISMTLAPNVDISSAGVTYVGEH